MSKLNVLISMMNADRYDAEYEYEPVVGEFTVFKNHECIESRPFTCSMKDYRATVEAFYNECIALGLTPSFSSARVARV